MHDLRSTTITTLEVAEMMEVEHWEILRKLDGRIKKDGSHAKGYIEVLNDNHLVAADYFIKSSYTDTKGEKRPCYKITKLGCDFLANKFNGEKGVLFTAKYVKRFYELEHMTEAIEKNYDTKSTSLGEVASYTKEMDKRMDKQGSEPYKVCEAFKMVSEQFGIRLPDDFVKVPEYKQTSLFDGISQRNGGCNEI